MTNLRKTYYLYWTLPVLFLVWELLVANLPFVKDLLPEHIRESIVSPPRSLSEAFAFKLAPLIYVFSTIGKYIYIIICFLLRKSIRVVLILTIVMLAMYLAIDYSLYHPLEMVGRDAEWYQVSLFHFTCGIIAYWPFYLCVYYLIVKMRRHA